MNDSLDFGPTTRKARVEIIPLIDVVFFLLATFVLFTLALQKLGSLEVPLPVADRGGPRDEALLYLDATLDPGLVAWRESRTAPPEMVSFDALASRLEDYKARTPDPKVFVRGEPKARFGSTLRILDAVRLASIPKVSIETAP